MEEATWKAIEGYRQTGLPVPVWQDGKVVYLSVDEALAARPDYQRRVAEKKNPLIQPVAYTLTIEQTAD